MMSGLPASLDIDGVAVITGGAGGFGLNVATRLVRAGMAVAILDVSPTAISDAKAALFKEGASSDKLLGIVCDVSRYEDCVQAQKACLSHFNGRKVSFLFNNAGITARRSATEHNYILEGSPSEWPRVFSVNVFGAVYILKAFLPQLIADGPLPSGKPTFVVTTSSVVGLLNHMPGPYSASKMAVTGMCEQLAIELEERGPAAAHISPRSLHPTIATTNIFNDEVLRAELERVGSADADYIVNGLFQGMDAGSHYIIVDDVTDVPSEIQIAARADDQRTGRRPSRPEKLGSMLALTEPEKLRARLAARSSKL
eukprot:m.13443 g.13443  ORF g.13443 m.13443 type:complete len:312 (+) comp8123_c0_seq1:81-1016(+)